MTIIDEIVLLLAIIASVGAAAIMMIEADAKRNSDGAKVLTATLSVMLIIIAGLVLSALILQ